MAKITQTCDYTSKAKIPKKQSRKKHTIVYHTYENMLQNAEMKQSKKHVRSTPDVCVWVSMGADGYMDTEGSKNKTNGGTNGRAGHVL